MPVRPENTLASLAAMPDRSESIFHSARVISDPAERHAFVMRECDGDPALLASVRSLLKAHDASAFATEEHAAPMPAYLFQESRHEPAVTPEVVQQAVGDRYVLRGRAGQGGMGYVFRAVEESLERDVAIKTTKHVVAGEQPRKRLVEEARAMARLRHQNLCRVIEVNDGDNPASLPYIVMEWIDGVPLSSAWAGWSTDRRIELFATILEAIGAAHGAGIVHRDLKPANIIVTPAGEPIIVDFGLARTHNPEASSTRSHAGTPGYAAPEQFWEDLPCAVGPHSDVYALGVILYEALTGRRPYEGDAMEVLVRARDEEPPLPERFAPESPPPLQRICLKALERNAEHRYADAGEMARDIERYRRGETVIARPSSLTGRFHDQIEEQIGHAQGWRRLGLITSAEFSRLTRLLESVRRSDSPWIIDSRRLTPSQVSLYLGGWLILVALTVGVWWTWDDMSRAPRQAIAWTAAAGTLIAGVALDLRQRKRIALACLGTATLVIPAALWSLLRDFSILDGAEGAGMGDRELLAPFFPESDGGLLNHQLLAVALVWLACSIAMRLITKSSAFTLFATIATFATVVFAWASLGRIDTDLTPEAVASELALVIALLALAMFPVGILRERAERSAGRTIAAQTSIPPDAAPVLTAAVVVLPLALGAVAYLMPERYIPMRSLDSWQETATIPRRAYAFLINGVVITAIARVLSAGSSPLRGRLAELLRWLIPTHFLGALLALEYDNAYGVWWVWLSALYVASVVSCIFSIPGQWKPFLYTGLAYLLIAYVRSFQRLASEFPDDPPARIAVLLVSLMLGAITLALGARLPLRLELGKKP